MLRRLHTRIIGIGAVCGTNSSPLAEVFLKSLPPPLEVDPKKYQRFESEEKIRQQQPQQQHFASCSSSQAPEPFYDIVHGSAGHKHVVLMTREGNLITFGENRYGQTAGPTQSSSSTSGDEVHKRSAEANDAPLFIDLGDAFASGGGTTACGSNYTFVYCPGGRRVIAFGNNHVGQLGIGQKQPVECERGFAEWNATAAYWGDDLRSVIQRITCGFNHSILQLSCGSILSFGSNTWGELGIGTTVSPMEPTRVRYFAEKGIEIVKVAAGNSFSLFLSRDGRVYGCGATNFGQLPPNAFEPVPIPLLRSFQQHANGSADGTKLIRVRDVACVGTMAVFLTQRGELLVQGALPDYGLHVPAPRFEAINQETVIEHFRAQLPEAADEARDFEISSLVQGPATLLVVYRNGCVAGFGANTDGQLQSIRRSRAGGRAVNVARAYSANELFPVLVPARPVTVGQRAPWFTCGSGFTLLFDHDEIYAIDETTSPIELPPTTRQKRTLRKITSVKR